MNAQEKVVKVANLKVRKAPKKSYSSRGGINKTKVIIVARPEFVVKNSGYSRPAEARPPSEKVRELVKKLQATFRDKKNNTKRPIRAKKIE